MLLISLVQPFKRTILIADTGIDDGEVIRRDVTPLHCQFFLLVEYFLRFIASARYRITIGQHRLSIPSLRGILNRYGLLKLSDAFPVHSLCQVSFSQKKVSLSIARIPLNCPTV